VQKGTDAKLTLQGKPIGKLSISKDGLLWEWSDRESDPVMTITGQPPLKKVDGGPGNIPWFLLEIAAGRLTFLLRREPFSRGYVQCIETEGGVAPSTAPEKEGEETRVRYKATYVFYLPELVGFTISGKVTYNGKPLPRGHLYFKKDDIGVTIINDGTYTYSSRGIGEYQLYLETEHLKGPANIHRYVKIPKKYTDPDQSGIKHTMKRGEQTLDIELTD
jgi:hypothetical protein